MHNHIYSCWRALSSAVRCICHLRQNCGICPSHRRSLYPPICLCESYRWRHRRHHILPTLPISSIFPEPNHSYLTCNRDNDLQRKFYFLTTFDNNKKRPEKPVFFFIWSTYPPYSEDDRDLPDGRALQQLPLRRAPDIQECSYCKGLCQYAIFHDMRNYILLHL